MGKQPVTRPTLKLNNMRDDTKTFLAGSLVWLSGVVAAVITINATSTVTDRVRNAPKQTRRVVSYPNCCCNVERQKVSATPNIERHNSDGESLIRYYTNGAWGPWVRDGDECGD